MGMRLDVREPRPREEQKGAAQRPGNPRRPKRPRMRLAGVLGEAWLDLRTGTAHACAMALALACLMLLAAGADLVTILGIRDETDRFVASGGSTYQISAQGRIDPAACDSLGTLDGVRAAGATRAIDGKLVFAALPSTGVPIVEASPGAVGIFAGSTLGTGARRGADGGGAAATAGTGTGRGEGVWLSSEAADPMRLHAGDAAPLADGRSVDVAGVYDWPDDGRQSGYSYTAVVPVPADSSDRFDTCWVRAWPVPDGIRSLLRSAVVGDDSPGQEVPVVSQLNTANGTTLDATALFADRLTAWTPWIALAAGVLLGAIAMRMRRLELASALHCGVPKTAMITQMLVETLVWTLAALALVLPLFCWVWTDCVDADALALTDALARAPVGAASGVLVGTLIGALAIRERNLFRYFKTR